MIDPRDRTEVCYRKAIGSAYDKPQRAGDVLRAAASACLLTAALFLSGIALLAPPEALAASGVLAHAGGGVPLA